MKRRLLKLVGFRWRDGRDFRFTWGEVCLRPCLEIGVGCSGDPDDEKRASLFIGILFPLFYIRLWPGTAWDHDDMWESYGISVHAREMRSIHLRWGKKSKIIDLPWAMEHVRHEVLMADGTWRNGKALDYLGPDVADGRFIEKHPYTYRLKSGEIQNRTATIGVDEREWRWKWFTWLPWPRSIQRCIDVHFSDEVGERAGSWKGGCIGCGYQMKRGEKPVDTLRRMERERKF